MQEEGSWDEDGRGGGVLPRSFGAWGWTIEELAAFTAVRQLMLVPERDFNPVWKPPLAVPRNRGVFRSDSCVQTAGTLHFSISCRFELYASHKGLE